MYFWGSSIGASSKDLSKKQAGHTKGLWMGCRSPCIFTGLLYMVVQGDSQVMITPFKVKKRSLSHFPAKVSLQTKVTFYD